MAAYQEEESGGKKALHLLLGPFVGLAYVIALPFISIVAIAAMVGRKLLGVTFDLLGNLVSFSWRPGEAYLGGKKKKEPGRRDYPNDS
ncbi:MAG: hypothetical protein P8Z71_07305 [Candidatus Sulfobium sp.]|jgi:hypothetical protein